MRQELTERIQRSFSRSFVSYHDAARQQAWIADRLVQELRDAGAPDHFRSVLELGCGTGLLTGRLAEHFSMADLTVNDIAPEARATAKARGAAFICGDAAQIAWPEKPDLIASASMIQWQADPAQLLQRAADALAPGGWLAVSGFGPQQYQELVQIGSSAGAPGLCQVSDLADAVQGRLEVIASGEQQRRMTFGSPRKVLEHLRQTGVNGRAQKPWSKSALLQFSANYIQAFGDSDGVRLTYHPIWIVARKHG